jgi:hypothetical protein
MRTELRRLTAFVKDLPFRTWSWMITCKENGMFKKRLIAGSILLALLVLFALTGCSSPAGADGAQGPAGPERVDGQITPEQLAELFTRHDQIRVVTAGAAQIAGIVPAGKTLEITGPATVADDGTLTINGTVHILSEGWLIAEGSAVPSGTIDRGSAGLLIVDGTLWADPTFFDNGIPPYVRIDPASLTATIVLDEDSDDALPKINALFEAGIPAIITDYDYVLHPVSLAKLPAWKGAKKLIARAAQAYAATSGTLDVSEKGQLVISGNVTLGSTSATSFATLKASDSGNVVVTSGGGIILAGSGHASLAGKITVNGTIAVQGTSMQAPTPATDPERIPATVDLSGATITGANGLTFLLPTAEVVEIGSINLGAAALAIGLNGSGTTAGRLTVGSIVNTSGNPSTLTLPPIPVDIGSIVATNGVSIAGAGPSSSTTLSPAYVSGGNLTLGANVLLNGPVELGSSTNTIILTVAGLGNLGTTEADICAQLAKIDGGQVNAGAFSLSFVSGTYNTYIFNAASGPNPAEATFKGNTIFNNGLHIDGLVTIDATAESITLNDDSTFGTGLNSTSSSVLTLNGTGRLTVTGPVTIGAIAVNNGNGIGLQLDGSVTNTFGKITVGDNSKIATAAGVPSFMFGPGTYALGTTGTFEIDNSGATINLPGPGTFVLGEQAEGNLTFEAGTGITAPTLVATNGVVTLSGKDYGAIIVENGSTLTQTFTAGNPLTDVMAIDLGKGGVIALAGANSTFLPGGAIIRGFTFHKTRHDVLTPQLTARVDQTSFRGSLLGRPYTGSVTIGWATGATYKAVYDPADTGPFVYGELDTIDGTTNFAAGTGGVLITRNSDIAE